MTHQRKLGILGEKIACRYLKGKGYQIIQNNFRAREGEIDLIARKNKGLVFIEVKTRSSLEFGLPEESFDAKKEEKFTKTINKYLAANNLENEPWKMEVISVILKKKRSRAVLRHLKSL